MVTAPRSRSVSRRSTIANPEGPETVNFALVPPGPNDGYKIDSTRVCGGNAITDGIWTIYDNTPGLQLVKAGTLVDVNNNGAANVGDTIRYTFTVTNIGNVPLTNVTVSDPKIPVIPGSPIATLAVGASQTLTAFYALTAGDISNDEVENTANAAGTPPGGGTVPSNPSTVTVPLDLTPGIEIEKSGTHNDGNRGYASVGDTVTYRFVVTNTGNVTLSNVTVTDPFFASIPGSPIASLAPGASQTLTATHVLTQANIIAASISNTATVSGTPPAGPPVSDDDTEVTPLVQSVGLTLVKTAGAPTAQAAGGYITYTFRVTNTGRVPLVGLTINDLQLSDPAVCETTTLAVNEVTTCIGYHLITQAEMNAGVSNNTAQASAASSAGTPAISPPSSTTTPLLQLRAMTVNKTVDKNTVFAANEVLNYTIKVRNIGTLSLTPIGIVDTLPNDTTADLVGPIDDINNDGVLDPTEEWTYTTTYPVTLANIIAGGDLINRVVVTAPGLSPQDVAVTTITRNPSLSVAKDVDQLWVNTKDIDLTYTILVANTGNLPLDDISVVDTLPTGNEINNIEHPLLVVGPTADTGVEGVLDVGETWEFKVTYTVTQPDIDENAPLINWVSVTSAETPTPVTDSAETGVVQEISMSVEKHVDQSAVAQPDTELTYSISVANTGNVTLANVAVSDMLPGAADAVTVSGPASGNNDNDTLDPGETWVYTITYRVTQADLDAGAPLVNTVTVTADPPEGEPIDGTGTATTLITRNPRLEITKTVDQTALIGPSTLTYTITLRNLGNVALSGIAVSDQMPDGTSVPAGDARISGPTGDTGNDQILKVGETWTYTVTYEVDQAAINSGDDVVNTARVSTQTIPATLTTPLEATATTEIQQLPSMSVTKLVDKALLEEPDDLDYVIRVTNTGNVTLTGVEVVDTLPNNTSQTLSAVPGGDTIPVGSYLEYTLTYPANQAAINSGDLIINSVRVESDQTPTPTRAQAETAVARYPGLSITKTGSFVDTDSNGFTNAGDNIRYDFTVLNSGNITLTEVTPVDPGPTFGGAPGTGTLSAITPVPPPGPITLGPGESANFTALYSLTQDDINAAAGLTDGVQNTAIATALFDGDEPVQSSPFTSELTVPSQEPALVNILKRALVSTVRRGETVTFIIEATNNSTGNLGLATIVDRLPPAFEFVEGSASIDSVPTTPLIEGRELRFVDIPIGPNDTVTIRLTLRALPTITPGRYTNVATILDDGDTPLAPPAEAIVDVLAEAVFDCSEVIGTVFNDRNRNGYQDQGEPGLPGVRLATVRGTLITTDAFGRYSVPCADLPNQTIGSNFVLKLDDRTLPTGFSLITRNPAMARLTAGKMTEINFAASVGRQVRIDLDGSAFVSGRVEPGRDLTAALDQLVTMLAREQSTLLVVFNDRNGTGQAQPRLANLRALVLARWKQFGAPYDLSIETRIVDR